MDIKASEDKAADQKENKNDSKNEHLKENCVNTQHRKTLIQKFFGCFFFRRNSLKPKDYREASETSIRDRNVIIVEKLAIKKVPLVLVTGEEYFSEKSPQVALDRPVNQVENENNKNIDPILQESGEKPLQNEPVNVPLYFSNVPQDSKFKNISAATPSSLPNPSEPLVSATHNSCNNSNKKPLNSCEHENSEGINYPTEESSLAREEQHDTGSMLRKTIESLNKATFFRLCEENYLIVEEDSKNKPVFTEKVLNDSYFAIIPCNVCPTEKSIESNSSFADSIPSFGKTYTYKSEELKSFNALQNLDYCALMHSQQATPKSALYSETNRSTNKYATKTNVTRESLYKTMPSKLTDNVNALKLNIENIPQRVPFEDFERGQNVLFLDNSSQLDRCKEGLASVHPKVSQKSEIKYHDIIIGKDLNYELYPQTDERNIKENYLRKNIISQLDHEASCTASSTVSGKEETSSSIKSSQTTFPNNLIISLHFKPSNSAFKKIPLNDNEDIENPLLMSSCRPPQNRLNARKEAIEDQPENYNNITPEYLNQFVSILIDANYKDPIPKDPLTTSSRLLNEIPLESSGMALQEQVSAIGASLNTKAPQTASEIKQQKERYLSNAIYFPNTFNHKLVSGEINNTLISRTTECHCAARKNSKVQIPRTNRPLNLEKEKYSFEYDKETSQPVNISPTKSQKCKSSSDNCSKKAPGKNVNSIQMSTNSQRIVSPRDHLIERRIIPPFYVIKRPELCPDQIQNQKSIRPTLTSEMTPRSMVKSNSPSTESGRPRYTGRRVKSPISVRSPSHQSYKTEDISKDQYIISYVTPSKSSVQTQISSRKIRVNQPNYKTYPLEYNKQHEIDCESYDYTKRESKLSKYPTKINYEIRSSQEQYFDDQNTSNWPKSTPSSQKSKSAHRHRARSIPGYEKIFDNQRTCQKNKEQMKEMNYANTKCHYELATSSFPSQTIQPFSKSSYNQNCSSIAIIGRDFSDIDKNSYDGNTNMSIKGSQPDKPFKTYDSLHEKIDKNSGEICESINNEVTRDESPCNVLYKKTKYKPRKLRRKTSQEGELSKNYQRSHEQSTNNFKDRKNNAAKTTLASTCGMSEYKSSEYSTNFSNSKENIKIENNFISNIKSPNINYIYHVSNSYQGRNNSLESPATASDKLELLFDSGISEDKNSTTFLEGKKSISNVISLCASTQQLISNETNLGKRADKLYKLEAESKDNKRKPNDLCENRETKFNVFKRQIYSDLQSEITFSDIENENQALNIESPSKERPKKNYQLQTSNQSPVAILYNNADDNLGLQIKSTEGKPLKWKVIIKHNRNNAIHNNQT